MPGVTVTALNTDTNVSTEAVTNAQRRVHDAAAAARAVQGHGGAAGLQDLRRAKASTLHTAETVTVNVPLSVGARRGDDHRQRRSTSDDRVEREHDLADDREQAHLGAAAQRPPGLHAAAADRRHDLHADDVRRDRLLGHARVGRQRLALGSRQPHRQQRVPDRGRAELRAPAAAPATGTTRRRSTRSRSSRSARRASTPRSAAPAAASST